MIIERRIHMNKEIIIGKKLTRGDVLKSFVVINLYTFIILGILVFTVFPSVNISNQKKMIYSVLIIFITWIVTVPMIGGTQRLEIDDQYIRYYHVRGTWNQFKEVLRILMKKMIELILVYQLILFKVFRYHIA